MPDRAELEIVGFPEEDDAEEMEEDRAELREMIAMHLATTTGREPSKTELEAEYKAVIAKMNRSAGSR